MCKCGTIVDSGWRASNREQPQLTKEKPHAHVQSRGSGEVHCACEIGVHTRAVSTKKMRLNSDRWTHRQSRQPFANTAEHKSEVRTKQTQPALRTLLGFGWGFCHRTWTMRKKITSGQHAVAIAGRILRGDHKSNQKKQKTTTTPWFYTARRQESGFAEPLSLTEKATRRMLWQRGAGTGEEKPGPRWKVLQQQA